MTDELDQCKRLTIALTEAADKLNRAAFRAWQIGMRAGLIKEGTRCDLDALEFDVVADGTAVVITAIGPGGMPLCARAQVLGHDIGIH